MNMLPPAEVANLLRPIRIETNTLSSFDILTSLFPQIQAVRDTAVRLLHKLHHPTLERVVDILNTDTEIQQLTENCTRGQDPIYYEIRECVELAYDLLQKEFPEIPIPTLKEIFSSSDEDDPLFIYLENVTEEVRKK
jgi:hypothetical protein